MNNLIFKHVIIPATNMHKGYNRINYYNLLKERDSLSLEQLQKIQWRKLKRLIYHCYDNIPYYRKYFFQNDIHPEDIKTLKHYSQLPELDKSTIRDYFEKLINPSLPKDELIYSTTGGSTGIPLKIYKSKEDQEIGFALRYRSNSWAGWNYWDKAAWVVSDLKRLDELTTLKKKLGLVLSRKLLLDTRFSSQKDMLNWTNQIKKFKPTQVYGYTSLMTEFAKFIIENNIEINGINGVFATAEPLNNRQALESAFNAKVYDQYGSSEIPCIAHECKHGNMHINIDEVLVEFVDIEGTDELKKIICTPLYIYGMPLLRYDLGDTGLASVKTCDCGLPYPLMELKVGRISDNFMLKDGKIVPTSALGWFIAREMDSVKQYKVIQEEYDKFIIKLVCPESTRENNEYQMKRIMFNLMQKQDIQYYFEYPDEILPDKNGKYRVTVSKIIEKNRSAIINPSN